MLHRIPTKAIPPREDQIKNEPMLFSADPRFAYANGGFLTRTVLDKLTQRGKFAPDDHVVIDTRVHMLKPGWIPAIGGWHCDAVPRGADGQPELDHPAIPGIRHYLCVVDSGTGSMTEFLTANIADYLPRKARPEKNLWGEHSELINDWLGEDNDGDDTTTLQSGEIYEFSARDYHRAIPATGHGWRFFFRASVETLTKGPLNEIRQQVQVYLPNEDWGW
ncbi:hypothetical protein IB265_34655 [Ensifer sp. ENS10]|uniref:hypothetical protein n=1 Tax=Ensifer sp. ENS10 TaxID=2769286 RepID=UPI00177F5908|nr:hypothetical protein [Ensifer sp. ENS10]MBD9511892.1 hypothetical protein [Ensifer sp. ENS10]